MSTLREELRDADPEDRHAFRRLLNQSMVELGLSNADCAELFDTSQPAVWRWMTGSNTPLPVMRRYALKCLLQEAEEQAE